MAISIVNIPVPLTGDGAVVAVANLVGEKTVELSGTFKGRYILLGTQDGSTFVPVAVFDANGRESFKQTLPLAVLAVRVRSLASNPKGVRLNVSGVLSLGANKFATVATVAPGSTGTQPVVDLFAVFAPATIEQDIGFLCRGTLKGAVIVEGSLDNIEFNAIGEFAADSQSPSLLGLNPPLEFSPLPTKDLVRYVRVTVNGVVTSTVTVTIGGSVPASGSAPAIIPVANWDTSLVRYIFLDGDSGNDLNLGYIDAPAGTIFTPAQTGPIAVRTTHRLNEIRKNVGAGRSVVALIKPRAGAALYDDLVLGDGHGQDDRSLLSGYKLMFTRGSDLTNSLADRQQLGFQPSFLGPNGDSSWTVGTLGSSIEGTTIQFVGATLPLSWQLPFYRIRWVNAGQTHYAPIRWGNTAWPGPSPDTLTVWGLSDPIAPGDHIWLEKPGVLLFGFNECANSDTTTVPGASSSSLDGVLFSGHNIVNFGHQDDQAMCHYSNLGAVVGSGINLVGTGTVQIDGIFTDETGNNSLGGDATGMGLAAGSMLFNGVKLNLQYSILATRAAGNANPSSTFLADYLSMTTSSIQTLTIDEGYHEVTIASINYGALNLYGNAHMSVSGGRGVNEWNSKFTLSPANSDSTKSYYFDDLHNILAGMAVPEPATPGFIMLSGRYTTVLNFRNGNSVAEGGNTIQCGSGARVEYNQDGTKYTLVKYAGYPTANSLAVTGFENIGGQKVVCMFSEVDNGYPGGILPCPRGVPMKIVNQPNECADNPPPSPAGLVVYGRAGDGGVNDGQVYYASADDLTPVRTPLGVTLTNYEDNIDFGDGHTGGYVLVSNDQIVVMLRNESSAIPAIGSPVFLAHYDGVSNLNGTFSTVADDDFNPVFSLGYVLPTGQPSYLYATICWQPGHHGTQAKLAHLNFTKTEDTTLDDVPGLFVQLESRLSYKIRAHLYYSTGSSPFNGGLKLAMGTDLDMTVDFAWFSIVGMQEIEDIPGPPTYTPKLEWVVTTGLGDVNAQSHTGGLAGWVDIEGVIKVIVGGTLQVRFGQATAVGGSTINQGSSITAIKTM